MVIFKYGRIWSTQVHLSEWVTSPVTVRQHPHRAFHVGKTVTGLNWRWGTSPDYNFSSYFRFVKKVGHKYPFVSYNFIGQNLTFHFWGWQWFSFLVADFYCHDRLVILSPQRQASPPSLTIEVTSWCWCLEEWSSLVDKGQVS